jgi:hypothetical protein
MAGMNVLRMVLGVVQLTGTSLVTIDATVIQHGAAAVHPAVLGDQLLAYLSLLVTMFNPHMHPGELAAGILPVTPMLPVAQMPPPSPSLLSIKNLVE